MSGRNPLARVRTDPLSHWVALLLAIVAGLVVASFHWVGLVVGGALVGLVASSLSRALLAGLGFGLIVVLAWMARLVWVGALGDVLTMGLFAWLAIAIAVVAPVLGSLLRGVV
jgi:hypothetical protein